MTIITVSRAATPDEISAEMDRRGAVIEKLETDLRHWREECGKLHSQLDRAEERVCLAGTGSLELLYDIRRALGWNDKTSLSILGDGVRRVRHALKTWDTPISMDLETLALAIKARVGELERINEESKIRIGELLESAEQKTDDCHGARDGECSWELCPQNRDGEPAKTGRHCPLDVPDDDVY